MESTASNETQPFISAVKLFFQILLLALFAYVQIDDGFKALNKAFSLDKSHKTEISFSLEKVEPLQIQLIHRVEGKEPVNANLSLTINGKMAKAFEIKETGTKRAKFVAPQALFNKGENRIAWKLTTSRPGVLLEELKLVNYVGINPNIPVAWVVPDEYTSFRNNAVRRFVHILLPLTLAVAVYSALNRFLFSNNARLNLCYRYLFIPLATFLATLLYGTFTPYKIVIPSETVFWLTGFGLLSAQLHSIIFPVDRDSVNQPQKDSPLLFLICLISILAYLHYFKNGWYIQDDYGTIDVGGRGSFWDSGKRISNGLYELQGRYQPIRLFFFSALNHLFEEEYSVYYNFALHLANLMLFYFLLRKFKAEPVIILTAVLLFSVFGRWRMMESPSVMIGGSGLNFFLISLTLLFLIKALETVGANPRRTAFLCLSILAYVCLVFSYEVSFPLILPIIYVFIVFNKELKFEREREKYCRASRKTGRRPYFQTCRPLDSSWKQSSAPIYLSSSFFKFDMKNRLHRTFSNLKDYSLLAPYFFPLIVYLLFFKLPAKGSYVGAAPSWKASDIWTRLLSYMDYTFSFRINLHHIGSAETAICLLYFCGIILAHKQGPTLSATFFSQKRNELKTILFGLVFYASSVVLFILNNWQAPNQVMTHHIYLMTVGSSILIVFSLTHLQWYLPGITFMATSGSRKVFRNIFLKKYYRYLLISVIFPLALISEASYARRVYEKPSVGITSIKPLKEGIQNHIDPAKTDAIIIKNFYHDYYGVTSVAGGFLQWFDFKYNIDSGRVILSARDDKIAYMGPLSFYKIDSLQERKEVANNRAQIFFLDNKIPLPYHDLIDFEKATNLYQTRHVWGDSEPDEFMHYRLDAILKNSDRNGFLEIKARSEKDLEWLIENTTRLEVNNKPIRSISTSGESLFIDIGASTDTANYFFLTLVSTDKHFKELLRLIRLQNQEGTVSRDIRNIPVGVDSWGIG